MLSANPIKRRFGDFICRSCINRYYHVKLEQTDCRYGYQYNCPCCHTPKNIVVGFSLSGMLKMLIKF